jgi:hypothetical protein
MLSRDGEGARSGLDGPEGVSGNVAFEGDFKRWVDCCGVEVDVLGMGEASVGVFIVRVSAPLPPLLSRVC